MKTIKKHVMLWFLIFATAFTTIVPGFASETVFAMTADEITNTISTSHVIMQCDREDSDGCHGGICNMCAMTNLLNRRLVVDNLYSASNYFNMYYTIRAVGYNGKKTDSAWTSSVTYNPSCVCKRNNGTKPSYIYPHALGSYSDCLFSIGTKNYKLTLIKYTPTPADVAAQIDAHPEGVFVRFTKDSGHCAVFTSYTKDSAGNYSFKVLDTVNSNKPIDFKDTWMAKLNPNFSSTYSGTLYVIANSSTAAAHNQNEYWGNNNGGGGSTPVTPVNPVTPPDPKKSTLKISPTNVPSGTLNKGDKFELKGTISSNYKITSASISIKGTNSANNVSKEIAPNATSVDIASSKLNTGVKFGDLAADSYKLVYKAVDESGKEVSSNTYSFKVVDKKTEPVARLKINLTAKPQKVHEHGKACDLKGTISAGEKITKVSGRIVSLATKKDVFSTSEAPNAKSYDIYSGKINSQLKFGKLDPGKYSLFISAQTKNEKAQYSYSFEVLKDASNVISISLTKKPSKLNYKENFKIAGTVSSKKNKITTINVSILKNGKILQTAVAHPYKLSAAIEKTEINKKLSFKGLKKGDYTLRVTVNAGTAYKKIQEYKFTVGKVSPITISTKVPAVIYKNGAFNITGSVSSSADKLRQISVFFSANGMTRIYPKTIPCNKNKYTFSNKSVVNIADPIKGVDLRKLKPGKYKLYIEVIDKKKNSDVKEYQVTVK